MLWLLSSASQAKKIRKTLGQEMRNQLLPILSAMGFQALRKKGVGKDQDGFPLDYFRFAETKVDVLMFQWDKYGRPSFIINFSMIDDPDYRNSLPPNVRVRWFIGQDYRASSSASIFEHWFSVGLIAGFRFPNWAIRRTVKRAASRLGEIDKFMNGSLPTSYLRDEHGVRKPSWKLRRPFVD